MPKKITKKAVKSRAKKVRIPTWETLRVGDILIDEDEQFSGDTDYQKTVLAVIGKVFILSEGGNFEEPEDEMFTIKKMKRRGYVIKDGKNEPSEVTMAEVCAKFGKNVKIKK